MTLIEMYQRLTELANDGYKMSQKLQELKDELEMLWKEIENHD